MARKRVFGRVLAGLMVAGASGLVGSSCAHDDTTLFVRDVLSPTPVAAGQQCIYTSDPTQPYITSGLLDVDFREEYDAEFLVGNQLVPEGNPSTPATETSFVKIEGGVVRITDKDGTQLNTFTTSAATTIPPSVGTTPTYAPIGLTILDPMTVASQTPAVDQGQIIRLMTYTRFFGHTLGGQSVESNEFEFPVDVCKGCLIVFSEADMNAAIPEPNCLGSGSTTATTVACVKGQDTQVECTQCPTVPDCQGTQAGVVADAGVGADAGAADAGVE